MDLKINIQTELSSNSNDYNFNNLIVISTSIFYIFEEEGITNIDEKIFIYSDKDTDIYLSNNNSYSQIFNFIDNRNLVLISLNENVELTQDNKVIGVECIIDLTTGSSYTFKNKTKVGVFNNYYSYVFIFISGIYSSFSLIRKIKITICYDTCYNCIQGIIGSSSSYFSTSFIDTY